MKLMLASCPALNFDCQVDSWRCLQPKAKSNFGQVKLIDIKNVPLTVRRISLKIGTIGILCRAV
jgi:hypothetical protein